MFDRRVLVPLAPLALRALLVAPGIRLVLMVVSAILAFLGGDPVDNPVGVVVLSAAIAIADIHRRHERMLWANLGYSLVGIAVLFGSVAVVVELAWALS